MCFRIKLGISGELQTRAPGVAVLAAVQFRGCSASHGLYCSPRDWAGVTGVEFQAVVLWALFQAASRFF